MRGATVAKNGCVAILAGHTVVRGDLWHIGDLEKDQHLTWIMRVPQAAICYDDVKAFGQPHAIFNTWYQWWQDGEYATIILPSPECYDYNGLTQY